MEETNVTNQEEPNEVVETTEVETNLIVEDIDFNSLDTEDLIETVKTIVDTAPIQSIKKEIDEAKKVFYERSKEAFKQELEKHLAVEGATEEDFDYTYPSTNSFKAILALYRERRNAYYKEQEQQQDANLKIKLELIEELKGLLNAEEKMKETFEHFKTIQERWKTVGMVPKADVNNLWQTYHHHVENFFDYLRINNELRDIEFKRNLEKKRFLCEQAEALDEDENLDHAFEQLQTLHENWKEVGPVGRDEREPVWERFKAATHILHKKRNDHFEQKKEVFEANFQKKIALCEKVENIDIKNLSHHNNWQKQTNIIKDLQDQWTKVGPVNRKQNTESWERFIGAIKKFNKEKNLYYKELKKNQTVNLQAKKDLVAQAEALANSTDWNATAGALKKIQSDWKNSGMAPRKEADQLWNKLRNACNTFFDNLSKHNSEKDKEFEVNLDAKQTFTKEVEAFKVSGNAKADVTVLKGFISKWKDLGRVPKKNVKKIESDFRNLIDAHFNQLDMEQSEKRDIQFKSRVEAIISEGDESKLSEELYHLQQKYKKTKEELIRLETNISFFSSASNDSPLLKDVKKNIENHRAMLDELQERKKYIKQL